MTNRPTPETEAALYRGMTATMTHAMLQRLERERDEARENWNRVSLEAEHWLSLASQRQDEITEVREQRDAVRDELKTIAKLFEASKRSRQSLSDACDHLQTKLRRKCDWLEDTDGNWDTECGECFSFAVGGKHAVYCCHCGGKIVAKEWRHEQLED